MTDDQGTVRVDFANFANGGDLVFKAVLGWE